MSDELDPGLRRLFAATAEHPADEAFVAAATARAARERRLGALGRALAGALLSALILAAVTTGLGTAMNLGLNAIGALTTASPAGWAAGLALVLAVAVCARALAPLAGLGRT